MTTSKHVLITGVSRGLGKILSIFLSEQGWTVFGTVRKISDFEDSDCIKYIYLDLENNYSIDKAIETIFSKTNKIDAVIHNAGIAYLDPVDVMSDEERRHTFDVNFFGPVYLTEKILPYFKKENDGKLIFISSIASIDPWPSLGVYSASKSALEKVAFEWAVLLKRWNIDVSIIRANPLPTDMQIMKSAHTSRSTYGNAFCNELHWEKIEDVCDIILQILHSSSPDFEFATGAHSKETINSLLKEGAYQNLIECYRKKLNTNL
jgi:NAD(P)-dependent dehydrogenase (short-subunit alcohol dehydrogenase family)